MDVYQVGQIARYMRDALEADPFLGDLWVQGELSNVTRSAAGHVYFTLKDSGGQLRAVMFRSYVTSAAVAVKDGAQVVAHGRMSFYEQRGDLSYIVDVLQPQGVGALELEFQRLKAKLEAEGLFDPGRKRRLPPFPRRIAVVTSAGGSVLHDIVHITRRRYPLTQLVVAPVPVQGDGAGQAIAEALYLLNQRDDLDLIILARGGGSMEDLWAFNEERVARAIFSAAVPVISAVGHETDVTIADLVADLRAPTPSAAAEMATPNRDDLRRLVAGYQQRAAQAPANQLAGGRYAVANLERHLQRSLPPIADHRRRIDDLMHLTQLHLTARVAAHRGTVDRHLASLEALNPLRTLERGYAIVRRSDDGRVVRAPDDVPAGAALDVQVAGGSFGAVAGGDSLPRPPVERPVPSVPADPATLPITPRVPAPPAPRRLGKGKTPDQLTFL